MKGVNFVAQPPVAAFLGLDQTAKGSSRQREGERRIGREREKLNCTTPLPHLCAHDDGSGNDRKAFTLAIEVKRFT